MNYKEGKEEFIKAWGELATNWGICKTMGQIHALLLISPKELCADQIKESLDISSGNANMNIRALMDWQLIEKIHIDGERRDYYTAQKDMWDIFRKIVRKRKEKELDPMIKLLDNISSVDGLCDHSKEFCKMVKELSVFSKRADFALSNITGENSDWFVGSFMKMVR